jgi:hypothetical protein
MYILYSFILLSNQSMHTIVHLENLETPKNTSLNFKGICYDNSGKRCWLVVVTVDKGIAHRFKS